MKCFHCGHDTVLWGNYFTFKDCEIPGQGIVHELSCTNCGAQITYLVKDDEQEDESNG